MKLVYEAKEFVPHASVDRKDRRSVHMFMAVAFGANVFAGITDVIQHAYSPLYTAHHTQPSQSKTSESISRPVLIPLQPQIIR